MKRADFLKMNTSLHQMLDEKVPFTRINMNAYGITNEQINEMQALHIFGSDCIYTGNNIWEMDKDKAIFINWYQNKFYPDATLADYDKTCISFSAKLEKILQDIMQVAIEEDMTTAAVVEAIVKKHARY